MLRLPCILVASIGICSGGCDFDGSTSGGLSDSDAAPNAAVDADPSDAATGAPDADIPDIPGCPTPGLAGGYPGGWLYRKPLSIGASNVPSTQSDFPVLVSLVTDTDLAADAQADFDDVLFTASDGTTKLSHEIEKFNPATGELVAWVKVPAVSSTTDTVIYMYYGNGTAGPQQDPSNVWDANFASVWHLSETVADEGTATAAHLDSTSNGNDGTQNGNDETAGIIGTAQDFDSSGDRIEADSFVNYPTIAGAKTISLWVYMTNVGSSLHLSDLRAGSTQVRIGNSNGGTSLDVFKFTGTKLMPSTVFPSLNQWHLISYTFGLGGSPHRIYVDGGEQGSGTVANDSGGASDSFLLNASAADRHMTGIIDEVRISNIARSAAWIQTEWNNQVDPANFLTVCGEFVF